MMRWTFVFIFVTFYLQVPVAFPRRLLTCIDMIKLDGEWKYKQLKESQGICGIYFIGETDEVLRITITKAQLNCDVGETIQLFDGWMMMNGVLPEEGDHDLAFDDRFQTTCGEETTLLVSQNFALIQFRLLPHSSFTLQYARIKTESPCNVVSPTDSGRYTLSSANRLQKCTFSIMYPSCISITELSLGLDLINRNDSGAEFTTTTCRDKFDVLKGDSLYLSQMTLVASYRGSMSWTGDKKKSFALNQSHSAVSISTSGNHMNSAIIRYSRLRGPEKFNSSYDDCS